METKTKKPKIEFLAVTSFGYAFDDSPAMAIQKAQKHISYGLKLKRNSREWREAQDKIMLWMVPSTWHGTDNYCPVDEGGNPVGILLHGHHRPEDKTTSFEVMDSAIKKWLKNK